MFTISACSVRLNLAYLIPIEVSVCWRRDGCFINNSKAHRLESPFLSLPSMFSPQTPNLLWCVVVSATKFGRFSLTLYTEFVSSNLGTRTQTISCQWIIDQCWKWKISEYVVVPVNSSSPTHLLATLQWCRLQSILDIQLQPPNP